MNNDDQYKMLFDNMTSGFALHEMIYDDEGHPVDYRFLEINSAFEELTGLLRENVVGKTVLQILPNTETSWITMYAKVVYTGIPVSFEQNSRVLDRFYEGWAYRPRPGQFAVIFSDITRFREMEKQLNEYRDNMELLAESRAVELTNSEQRYEMLFDHIIDPVIITDNEGHLLEWNRATLALLNEVAESLTGKNICDILKCENELENILEIIQSEGSSTAEGVAVRKDASEFPVRISANRFALNDKERLMVSFSDITREKELRSTLFAAKVKAEKASQAKSRFLSNVSHDIRTPINEILGMLHMLEDTSLTETQKELLKNIGTSSRFLYETINGILDFSKIESGKMNIEPRVFNLGKLLQEIVQQYKEITVDLAEELPETVIGDPLRISQVINSMLKAVKPQIDTLTASDMPDPRPEENHRIAVTITEMVRLHNTSYIEAAVRNFGPGMDRKQIESLLDPIAGEDDSALEIVRGEGSSFSLAIANELAALMGGKIISTGDTGIKGNGMILVLKLPLRIGHDTNAQKEEKEEGIFNGVRILVAEDHKMSRDVLEKLLSKNGAVVTAVENGKEAVDRAEKENFDLILMDIRMPVMDGLKAAQKIRKLDKTGIKKVVILAITAHAMIDDIRKSWDAGMNGHITKPIRPKDLITQLQAWLAR